MGDSDLDRKLAEAANRSPELAAMLAGRHDGDPGRYRRLAVVVLGVAAVVGGAWFAASRLGGGRAGADRPHEAAQEIDTSRYLEPIKTEAGAAGEQLAAFEGFAVSIETEPPGAVVTVAGVLRGEAPVLASVACRPGEKVAIRAELPGVAPVRRETTCRADTLVKLTVRVGK